MKAIIQSSYGPPDIVRYENTEIPNIQDDEVLIKVHTTTVNRTDCGFRSGKPYIVRLFSGLLKPKQPTLGNEFSGVIDKIGSKVNSYQIGDAVFGITGDDFGAHAQYMRITEDGPFTFKPKNISFEEAGAMCEGFFYALNYFKEFKVKPGDKILINGASGSIGSSAVQLAKYYGAEITAVIGTKNLALAKKLGAHKVIDYQKEDFTNLNDQFDFILDAVGKSTFFKCKKLLKPRGIYTSTEFGPYVQNPFLTLWTNFFGKKKVIFPIPKESAKDIQFFKQLTEDGHIKVVIDRRYHLHELSDAYRYVETGEKTGAVAINIPQD